MPILGSLGIDLRWSPNLSLFRTEFSLFPRTIITYEFAIIFCNLKLIFYILFFLPHSTVCLRPTTTHTQDDDEACTKSKTLWTQKFQAALFPTNNTIAELRKGKGKTTNLWYSTNGTCCRWEAGGREELQTPKHHSGEFYFTLNTLSLATKKCARCWVSAKLHPPTHASNSQRRENICLLLFHRLTYLRSFLVELKNNAEIIKKNVKNASAIILQTTTLL